MNKLISIFKNNWRKLIAGLVLCTVALVLVINSEHQESSTYTNATKNNTVTLNISGEVVKPGIYKINIGTTIDDNMHLFGGFTMNADLTKLNTSAPITSDTEVIVNRKKGTDNQNYDALYSLPD